MLLFNSSIQWKIPNAYRLECNIIYIVLETVSAFKINRSSFKLNNLFIFTAFEDEVTYVEMIRSIHNPLSTITMTNLNLNIQGDIFKDFDLGTSLYVDNIACGKRDKILNKHQ